MVNSGQPIRCTLIWMRQIIKSSQLDDSDLKLWHLNVKKGKEKSKAHLSNVDERHLKFFPNH